MHGIEEGGKGEERDIINISTLRLYACKMKHGNG
jgi:hypothetical protein